MRNLTHLARKLRKESTEAERMLWKYLRGKNFLNLKFRRQEQIGDYIVDFVCYEKKIIIELDGGYHNQVEAKNNDEMRQSWLVSQGFTVIRFWNSNVMKNIEGVLQVIKEKTFPPLNPLPQREGKIKFQSSKNSGGFYSNHLPKRVAYIIR